MDPLPPLPPLSSAQSAPQEAAAQLGNAIALFGACAAGIFHALGAKLFERAWTYLNLP